jgi:hypothetical protein
MKYFLLGLMALPFLVQAGMQKDSGFVITGNVTGLAEQSSVFLTD